jgi:P27 family predicted phage terminase small subunit
MKTGRKGAFESTKTAPTVITKLNIVEADTFLNSAKSAGLGDTWFDEIKIWNRIAPQLSALGRLNESYLDLIIIYCQTLARVDRHKKLLDIEGWSYTVVDSNGNTVHKTHPIASQVNVDNRVLRTCQADLGLSPSATFTIPANLADNASDDFDLL